MMNINLSQLSFNEKLAACAFLLSFLAMVASVSTPNTPANQSNKPSYVTVLEMAHWIKNREEVQLIDLREKALFDEFHVPTASHVPLTDLLDAAFDPQKKIVLYAGKETHEIQAWLSLTGVGHAEVHILRGGAYDWHQRILYPKLPKVVTTNAEALVSEIKKLTNFYGGRVEYVNSDSVLNYYSENKASREIISRKNKARLVRMGC